MDDRYNEKLVKWPWESEVLKDWSLPSGLVKKKPLPMARIVGTLFKKDIKGVVKRRNFFGELYELGIDCVIYVAEEAYLATRNSRFNKDSKKWLVDAEIGAYGTDIIFWHHERKFDTEQQAMEFAEKIKSYIDTKSLNELSQEPGYGNLQMRKFKGARLERINKLLTFLKDGQHY